MSLGDVGFEVAVMVVVLPVLADARAIDRRAIVQPHGRSALVSQGPSQRRTPRLQFR